MVEIKITGATPLEALASLTAFGCHCMSNAQIMAAANGILEAGLTENAKPNPSNPSPVTDLPPVNTTAPSDLPSEPYIEEPPHEDPAPATQPAVSASNTEDKPRDTPKPPTLEEVRAIGLAAAKKYGQPAIKAVLDKYHAPSMTALAESDRKAFMADLEELGGPNA